MYLEFLEMMMHVVHIDMYLCCPLGNQICILHKDVKLGEQLHMHHAMCYRGHGQAADAESGGESDEKLGIEH